MSDSCDPMDCSLPGSSIQGILQARILEWVDISYSRGSSRSRNQTPISCVAGRFFTNWAMREALCTILVMLDFNLWEFLPSLQHTHTGEEPDPFHSQSWVTALYMLDSSKIKSFPGFTKAKIAQALPVLK